MRELETLEIRLAGALNRISAHLDKPDRQDDNFELERIERLERRILILTDQLEAQETENARLSKVIAELVKSNQIIPKINLKVCFFLKILLIYWQKRKGVEPRLYSC